MTLKGNLYDIVSTNYADGLSSYTIKLNPQCIIYKAHFPGMPITPGVCIIELVKELFEANLNERLRIIGIKNAKFISVLTPDVDTVNVTLSKIEVLERSASVQAVVFGKNDTIYAKISIQAVIA